MTSKTKSKSIKKILIVKKKETHVNVDCNICFEPITESDKIKTLKCNHFYHKECIKLWFKTTDDQCHIYEKKHCCPYCRT